MAKKTLAELLHARLVAQADIFSALSDHSVLVGLGRERALGALLGELAPRRYEILDGAIAARDAAGRPAKSGHQIDLMIVDTDNYPVLLREGSTCVVLPEAVHAAVEVKSNLSAATFLETMEHLGRVRLAGVPTVLSGQSAAFRDHSMVSALARYADGSKRCLTNGNDANAPHSVPEVANGPASWKKPGGCLPTPCLTMLSRTTACSP